MKEEIEILVGTNGNKKEKGTGTEAVKQCCGCNNYAICNVREQVEKLANVWAKVSMNLNNIDKLYTNVASDCICYVPLKEGK